MLHPHFRALPALAFASAALFTVLFAAPRTAHAGPDDSLWIPLFNKSDTNIRNNWDVKIRGSELNVDTRNTFRYAVNGADTSLEVNYSGYTSFTNGGLETFGHAAYKHRPFSHYLLRSEYQVWGTQVTGGPGWANQNNGFMLHSQSMASMGLNQNFPVSLEAQLLGPGNGGSTMNLCTPGTSFYTAATGGSRNDNHCTNSSGGPTRAPVNTGWQSVAALVLGDSIHRYYSGGTLVFTFYRPVHYNGDDQVASFLSASGYPKATGTPLTEGYISIQGESAPYRFRKIELLNLAGCMTPITDVNYKSYLVKHDSTACAGISGIRGQSPRDARVAAPMTFIGGAIKVGGNDRVTLEVFDMRGARIGRHAAQAPFLWAPKAQTGGAGGVHLIRAITPKGTYTERAALF